MFPNTFCFFVSCLSLDIVSACFLTQKLKVYIQEGVINAGYVPYMNDTLTYTPRGVTSPIVISRGFAREKRKVFFRDKSPGSRAFVPCIQSSRVFDERQGVLVPQAYIILVLPPQYKQPPRKANANSMNALRVGQSKRFSEL